VPERVNVRTYGEARYWKAFMLWRLGEFNVDLRVNEPAPRHRAYGVAEDRAAQVRAEVTSVLRGAGLTASQASRYD
jgi:hypothetical protein